jgi:hypothetical protein
MLSVDGVNEYSTFSGMILKGEDQKNLWIFHHKSYINWSGIKPVPQQ